jgi:hypothetical protein
MKTKLLLSVIALVSSMISCTKDDCDSANVSDNTISAMTTVSDGFDLIHSSRTNDNSEWKIKMNDVASKSFAEGSKNFPNNSMIVKEKYDASGMLTGYDVKFKAPADVNSVDGWLWSQLSSDGRVIYASNLKGASCQSCHSTQGKRMMH